MHSCPDNDEICCFDLCMGDVIFNLIVNVNNIILLSIFHELCVKFICFIYCKTIG